MFYSTASSAVLMQIKDSSKPFKGMDMQLKDGRIDGKWRLVNGRLSAADKKVPLLSKGERIEEFATIYSSSTRHSLYASLVQYASILFKTKEL